MANNWIWFNGKEKPHWAVRFRKVVDLTCDVDTAIRIAAENDCILYIDGKEVFRGCNPEYFNNKSWTPLQYKFTAGRHVIAIWAYYTGEDFQTVVNSHSPGLFFEAQLSNGKVITADESWRCSEDSSLLRDRIDKVDFQLGFVFGFDNRLNDDYLSLDYDDSSWQTPRTFAYNGNFHARTIPPMQKLPEIQGKLLSQGSFYRNNDLQECYARMVAQDDYKSASPNGAYSVYDLGENYFGLMKLEVEADAGTVFDISHGEVLCENRVRSQIHSRNFTDRFIASGKGVECCIFPRRIGGEFIQINTVNGKVKNLKVSLIPLKIELPEVKLLTTSDPSVNKILESSKKTLEMCMLEHYVDCPWREQALYAGDSRWQMLWGYHLWGNYKYAAYNLELLGESLQENNLLSICSPCTAVLQITSFTIHWMNALCEYTIYSGDRGVWERTAALRDRAIRTLTARLDPVTGLYYPPCGKKIWNFYEWSLYLDGFNGNTDATNFDHLGKFDEMDSVYNMLLIEMFRKFYQLTGNESYRQFADETTVACRNYFYDAENKYTRFYSFLDMKFEFVNALALYTGVVPEADRSDLIGRLMSEEFTPSTLSSLFYTVEVMANHSTETRTQMHQRLLQIFSPMLEEGKTATLWETADGASAFDGAGSLCHGWSAIPIYFYSKYMK